MPISSVIVEHKNLISILVLQPEHINRMSSTRLLLFFAINMKTNIDKHVAYIFIQKIKAKIHQQQTLRTQHRYSF